MHKRNKRTFSPFRVVAYGISAFFCLLILYPLLYITANAMKDSSRIYDVPPSILPDAAQSLSIVVDYSHLGTLPEEELLAMIQQDHIVCSMASIYELQKDSVFEVRFYGMQNGKTIYFARGHRARLDLEKDFGVYKGTSITQDALTYDNKVRRAADSLGYTFSPGGLEETAAMGQLGQNELEERVNGFMHGNFHLNGEYLGTTLKTKNILLLESFVHYVQLPRYVYSQNPVLAKYSFGIFFLNTAIVLACAVVCQVTLCALTAFPLSRLMPKKQSNLMLMFFLGTTMIPFVSVMIPQFTMFRSMGLYNNYGALLLPHLLPFGFFVYLYKGFFDNLPSSLFEAAQIDGASNLYTFFRICMPLSKPIISVIALQTFLSNWNDFFWAWMVTEKQQLWTLNVALYNISKASAIKPNFIMGISLLTIVPVLLLTLLFSKQIKASVAASGIKG